jgi:hypothetical protein
MIDGVAGMAGSAATAHPAARARPQKMKGISIFVDCWYSG